MDRLYETLGEKMQLWTSLKRVTKEASFIGENTLELEQLMVERLIVAYDLLRPLVLQAAHENAQRHRQLSCHGRTK
jgi:hypothetical protein